MHPRSTLPNVAARPPSNAGPARAPLVALAFALALFSLLLAGCGGGEDLGGPKLEPAADTVLPASAAAMGEVTSVRFDLTRSGGPIYIDQVGSLSLDTVEGRFSYPGAADALLQVTVDGSLTTQLGAIALDGEVWLSNPITGDFETLPPGYDLDPTMFFDPQNGWQPLMASLQDVEFIGEVDRDGTRYHIRGTAPAERIDIITAGLVDDQDVEADFWLHPVTGLVTSTEFSTVIEGETVNWRLDLSEYGEAFDITPPEDLA